MIPRATKGWPFPERELEKLHALKMQRGKCSVCLQQRAVDMQGESKNPRSVSCMAWYYIFLPMQKCQAKVST